MMRRKWCCLLAFLLIAAAGCGSDTADGEGNLGIDEDADLHADADAADDVVEDEGCDSDRDCDDGLTCQPTHGERFDSCQPAPEPAGADDGEACEVDGDCGGNTCIPGPQWPGGHCTTVNCRTHDDCASTGDVDNRCLSGNGMGLCVRSCEADEDCRDGYVCQSVFGGNSFCSPESMGPGPGPGPGPGMGGDADPGLENPEEYPFEITCGLSHDGGQLDIDYEVAEDSTSYMITPLARDASSLSPSQISLPDGTSYGFGGDNDFQTMPSQLFGFINPILTPAIAALSDQLQAGEHTLTLDTESEDLCYLVLEESTPGTTIDFNIYLVGVDGIDAATAAEDTDMQETLEWFETIYEQAGIELDEVNYHDITGDEAEAYQIIRSEADLKELVSLSEKPDGDYDDVLSANVFFVQSMQIGGGGGGAIGVSQGIPGAAGLHGTPSSGVIFTSEYLGEDVPDQQTDELVDGNELTGIVLAHEMGHYLGLFHTSEQLGQMFDPLDDTPQCTSGFPDNCPDIDNLMFPLAGVSHTEMTEGQIHTIKANPLTKD